MSYSNGKTKSLGSFLVLIFLAAIWLMTTLGLFITSLRAKGEAQTSGWWDVLLNPFSQDWDLSSYTTVLTDDGKLITADNAASIALTIPPNSSVAYGIGTQINVMQLGAGTVTITAGAGVTLRSDGSKLKTNAQYAVATCCKIATDTWVVVGNLSA